MKKGERESRGQEEEISLLVLSSAGPLLRIWSPRTPGTALNLTRKNGACDNLLINTAQWLLLGVPATFQTHQPSSQPIRQAQQGLVRSHDITLAHGSTAPPRSSVCTTDLWLKSLLCNWTQAPSLAKVYAAKKGQVCGQGKINLCKVKYCPNQ